MPAVLREARQSRGLSLEHISTETRIARVYLEAFEGRVGTDRLPPSPYGRYFLREYANYLGLAEEALIEASPVAEDHPEPITDLLPLAGPKRRRWPARILAGASTAGIIALVAFRVAFSGPSPSTSNLLPPAARSPATAPGSSTTAPVRPAQPAMRGIRTVLHVSAPSWVQATADGKVVLQETVPAGRSLTIDAKSLLKLVLGDAGNVRLSVNGKPVATGGFGQVVQLTFAWRGGRVVPA